MKLIKCNNCGRPFYNDAEKCPYCGSATKLSANNFVTKSITTPQSHKLMEDVLSGNYQPRFNNVERKTEIKECNCEDTVASIENRSNEECNCEDTVVGPLRGVQSSTGASSDPASIVKDRAEAISNIAQNAVDTKAEELEMAVDEVETAPVKKKRKIWLWLSGLMISLAIAAAIILKWTVILGIIQTLIAKFV